MPRQLAAWNRSSFSLIGIPRRYLPGTIGPEMIASRSPANGWPLRTCSIVTYSHSWPASRTAPAKYRGYGERNGGTPKFDGSSTNPSRMTTFTARTLGAVAVKRVAARGATPRYGHPQTFSGAPPSFRPLALRGPPFL